MPAAAILIEVLLAIVAITGLVLSIRIRRDVPMLLAANARQADALKLIAANGRNGHACSSGQCTITYHDKRVETYVCPICVASHALAEAKVVPPPKPPDARRSVSATA